MLLWFEMSVWRVVTRLGDKFTVLYLTHPIKMINLPELYFPFYFTLISAYLVYLEQESELCEITSLIRMNILKNIDKNKSASV
jgi:hypothetical protein